MKIGWASIDTTPERPVNLHGQFHVRISERVNDPLLACALAVENDGQQAVLVGCDWVGIPGWLDLRVREAVAARVADFDPRYLILNATHTHTSPQVDASVYPDLGDKAMKPTESADFLVEKLATVVAEAWGRREAGGLSRAYGHAVVGHNRRVCYLGGQARMYGRSDQADFEHFEGYEDHGVDLLYAFDPTGRLTGVIVNLACPSQVTEGEHYVSADFWHETRLQIAERLGTEVFVLPQCAAAGDQSPHLLLEQGPEELMRRRRGLTEREEIGRRLAAAVADSYPLAAAEVESDPVLRHTVADVDLPVRLPTRAEYDEARARLEEWDAKPGDPENMDEYSYRHVQMLRCRGTISRYETEDGKSCYSTEVHAVRLGEVAVATNPFELFLDYGLRIKARSCAPQTFIVQLCGSGKPRSGAGYLPTARAVAAHSYGAEVADNNVGPVGGQMLVDHTVDLISGLW